MYICAIAAKRDITKGFEWRGGVDVNDMLKCRQVPSSLPPNSSIVAMSASTLGQANQSSSSEDRKQL